MTSREAFEAIFERPAAIIVKDGAYEVRQGWEDSYAGERFLGQASGWQAAVEWASKRAQEACDNMDCAHRCQVGHEFKTAIKEALK